MADTKTQNRESEQQRSSESQRGVSRREDYFPSRDLFHFSPFSMMRRLSEEMDRAFASTLGLSRGSGEAGMWAPAVEVRERNGNLEIRAELPGLEKSDVNVECTDDGLIIQGEKRHEHQSDEGGYHRSELSYGRFYRVITLPEGANAEKAKAEFKNGVLNVQVPVTEQRRNRRQIPINT